MNTGIALGRIETIHFVHYDRAGLERAEPMRETAWDKKLVAFG